MASARKRYPLIMEEIKYKPTPQQHALDAEVERRKQRDIEKGKETKILDTSDMANATAMIDKKIKEMSDGLEAWKTETLAKMDNLPKQRPCTIHPTEIANFNSSETMRIAWKHRDRQYEKVTPIYDPCELCISERLVNERYRGWISLGVPRKVAHAYFENYEADTEAKRIALAKCREQAKKGRGFVILCGNPGNGKTHLAVSIMKASTMEYLAHFITHSALCDELRQTYEDGGKKKLLEKYRKTRILVVDELDETVKGDDVLLLLYGILAYRYDNDLLTVLTSNHDLATVLRIVGPRLEDRMAQNYTVANFTWESYRKQHRET